MKSQAYKGHLAMLGANILWGLMSPVSKAVLIAGPISALSLTTFRMVGAAVIFWLASLFTKKEHVNHQDLMKLFFAALLGIVLNQGSFIFGVSLTSPINASDRRWKSAIMHGFTSTKAIPRARPRSLTHIR